jgi:hypothetical protein
MYFRHAAMCQKSLGTPDTAVPNQKTWFLHVRRWSAAHTRKIDQTMMEEPKNTEADTAAQALLAMDQDYDRTHENQGEQANSVGPDATKFSLADWRWAAKRGYWNPDLRLWNEEIGGKEAYVEQRDKRREKRKNRKPRVPKKLNLSKDGEEQLALNSDFSVCNKLSLLNFMAKKGFDRPVVRR